VESEVAEFLFHRGRRLSTSPGQWRLCCAGASPTEDPFGPLSRAESW